METWFLILASFCVATIIGTLSFCMSKGKKLPPGPSFFLSHMLLLTKSFPDLQSIIRDLKTRYGPLISLFIGSHPFVFVSSHSLTHQALIKKGTTFSDRPKSYTLQGISTASYGPTWRLFRSNLAKNMLRPSHVKSYSCARMSVLGIMITQFQKQYEAVGTIKVFDHIQLAMLHLAVLMCFGQKLDDYRINEIARVHGGLLSVGGSKSFDVFISSPWLLVKSLFGNKWKIYDKLCDEQNQLLIPLIKSRIEALRDKEQNVAYIDTLVKLRLPKEVGTNRNGGKLTLKELVSMCAEFLFVGTEGTSSSLQWIMANIVKHPSIQSKLYDEIVAVVGPPPPPPPPGVEPQSVINEESLQKITYLRAVVLEGLRRHPPTNLLLPHMVSADAELEGYKIPKGSTINFMVAEMGLDPEVWDDPMEFNPERFLSNESSGPLFNIAGRKEIKMIPFGAGRRICPGVDLAMLHLEYFVANLIWYFHWTVPDGSHIDLTEQLKYFTIVMKNPLRTKISSRTT